MPLQSLTFEPSERTQPAYQELMTALAPWGALRPQPILTNPRLHPGPPASTESLMEVYGYLRSPLPARLEHFWEVADGLRFDFDSLVFSTTQFVKENQRMRTLPNCMPFDGMYFIGSLGDGDMFAMGRPTRGEWNPAVMIWEHETDRRYEVADSLIEYVAKMIIWWSDESHPLSRKAQPWNI